MNILLTVYIVQHAHEVAEGSEDVKLIGVYASRGDAQAAVDRLSLQPGFCDHQDGFHIDEYLVGKDHWTEGFIPRDDAAREPPTVRLTLMRMYAEHRDAPFETAWDAIAVDGIDLRILEDGTAGPLYQFFDGGGRLDVWQTAILGLCCHDLAVVVRGLDGDAKAYFGRLEILARSVLAAVRDAAPEA